MNEFPEHLEGPWTEFGYQVLRYIFLYEPDISELITLHWIARQVHMSESRLRGILGGPASGKFVVQLGRIFVPHGWPMIVMYEDSTGHAIEIHTGRIDRDFKTQYKCSTLPDALRRARLRDDWLRDRRKGRIGSGSRWDVRGKQTDSSFQ